jgi:hypothetical protein
MGRKTTSLEASRAVTDGGRPSEGIFQKLTAFFTVVLGLAAIVTTSKLAKH